MAIGVLMGTAMLTSEQAFDRLVGASQRSHRKLRDIAEDVVELGVIPDEAS
jgi:AmiR/NasT family two-component response regulator